PSGPKLSVSFDRSAEFCHGNETWKLNLAHTLYMQEKYKEASDCYAPLVRASFDKLLDVSAAVLANLCACYVMTCRGSDAASGTIKFISPPLSHNLVIGTLYCSKGNYEFGISRIVRALEPCEKKLGVDTWFYSKRCMASMLENIARCVIELRDEMLLDCLHFLESCEMNGREIVTDAQMLGARAGELPRTVAHEARLLRALLLQIMD
uniref:Tetratricopeptide repeat protein 30 n=1 Tax=Globodera pallida TaxID=36090 RepID=A0A183CQM1_GLOPA